MRVSTPNLVHSTTMTAFRLPPNLWKQDHEEEQEKDVFLANHRVGDNRGGYHWL
jgi:hypothetical protein